MQVTETSVQGLKREFKVVFPAEDLAKRVEGQLAEIKAKAQIPGFRPGKVPVSHLKRLYGRAIMAEVVQDAVKEANRKIIEDNQLRLATQPAIDFANESEGIEKIIESQADLSFTVALEVLPQIEVASFDDIAIERLVVTVSDTEVDKALTRLAEVNRGYIPKEGSAKAEKGDKVTVDFTGEIEGKPFEGGSGEDADIVLGSGGFLPGFETQIEGMHIGETRTIVVAFPDDYGVEALAGKAAQFSVTLKGAAAPAEIAIDDELAKGLGFEDLGKLKEAIRANIERDYAAASRGKWKRDLLDALDKRYTFAVPEGMVGQEFEGIWRRVEADQKASGRSFEAEGTTEEAARADYRKIAERRVKLGLLLAEIGERAQIKVTDEEVAQAVAQRARAFPGQEKSVWDFYRKYPQALTEVRAPIFEEKVADFILTQAKVTEREVPAEELLKLAREDEENETREAEAAPE